MESFVPIIDSHPRIHFNADTLSQLQGCLTTTHADLYKNLLTEADNVAEIELPEIAGRGDKDRQIGEMLALAAFAYKLSGNEKYLVQVRRFLKPVLAAENWGDGVGLVTGHTMGGAACVYDWLQEELSSDELDEIRLKMIHVARTTYTMASQQRIWWHDYFQMNWCQVPTATLAYAAAALGNELPEAEGWIRHADDVFTHIKETLPRDGNSSECQSYLSYSFEWILRYFDIARSVYGIDHYDCDFLRNAPYILLHAFTPCMRVHDHFMAFGDARRYTWYGPSHLLYRCADEYNDGYIQDFANCVIKAGIQGRNATPWMNMIWYNPDLACTSYKSLPTFRYFDELPTVYTRSGWDEDALHLGFKCTKNHTDYIVKNYPGRDLGAGHSHPDAASFQINVFGEWMAIDPGYTNRINTRNHNTIIVNGIGQLGEGHSFYEGKFTFNADPCTITDTEHNDDYDYIRADASGIYDPDSGLIRFIRHVVFIKPHMVIIIDELESGRESEFEWLLHTEEPIHEDGNSFVLQKNEAYGRVMCLHPREYIAENIRHTIDIHDPAPFTESSLLSIKPEKKCTAETMVHVLNFQKGEAPPEAAKLESLNKSEAIITIDNRKIQISLGETEPGIQRID